MASGPLTFESMRPSAKPGGSGPPERDDGGPGLAAARALRTASSDEEALEAFEELYAHCRAKKAERDEDSYSGGGARNEGRDGGR